MYMYMRHTLEELDENLASEISSCKFLLYSSIE